jgi:serine/threonine protein phosphatase 1
MNRVKIKKNITSEKIIAIGDIHGYFSALEKANKTIVDHLRASEKNIVVFLGDLVDRGPQSFEIVQYCIDLMTEYDKQVYVLRGNHEQMLLDACNRASYYSVNDFYNCGGKETVNSYCKNLNLDHHKFYPLKKYFKKHLSFYKSLPHILVTQKHIFVHAGLFPEVPLRQQDTESVLWIRDTFILSNYDFGKVVVYGHTPIQNMRNIHTGGVSVDSFSKVTKICLDGGLGKYFHEGHLRIAHINSLDNQDFILETFK